MKQQLAILEEVQKLETINLSNLQKGNSLSDNYTSQRNKTGTCKSLDGETRYQAHFVLPGNLDIENITKIFSINCSSDHQLLSCTVGLNLRRKEIKFKSNTLTSLQPNERLKSLAKYLEQIFNST